MSGCNYLQKMCGIELGARMCLRINNSFREGLLVVRQPEQSEGGVCSLYFWPQEQEVQGLGGGMCLSVPGAAKGPCDWNSMNPFKRVPFLLRKQKLSAPIPDFTADAVL
jgi:hypothetical protein